MKKIFLIFIVFFFFIACSSKQDSTLLLFNNIHFQLSSNEKVVDIDPDKNELFNSYLNNSFLQIPLFKCIKSDNYTLFIAIPFNSSIKELTEYNLSNSINQTLFIGDSINYFYKKIDSEKEHITIYSRNFDNNLILVLSATESANLSDSLFNIKSISSRFKY